jgi:hypothetical protein
MSDSARQQEGKEEKMEIEEENNVKFREKKERQYANIAHTQRERQISSFSLSFSFFLHDVSFYSQISTSTFALFIS